MIDLLAICAHPDDLEVCVGGIFIKAKKEGKKTGLIVMTRGESGGHAVMETRISEGKRSAEILQLDYYRQLSYPDAGLFFCEETVRGVIPYLRECAPRVIVTLHPDDCHPDHKAVSQITDAAAFAAGLSKYSKDGSDWHYDGILHFTADFRTNHRMPDILVDISDVAAEKRAVCEAHASQNVTEFSLEMAKALGRIAKVAYAEGLYLQQNLLIDKVSGLFRG